MSLNSISPKVLKRKSIFVSLHISTYVILVGYTHSLQVVIQLFLHVLWLRARLPIVILSSLVYGTNFSRLHLVHAAAVSLPEHAPTYYSHPITTSLAFCTMPHYFKILLVSITSYVSDLHTFPYSVPPPSLPSPPASELSPKLLLIFRTCLHHSHNIDSPHL